MKKKCLIFGMLLLLCGVLFGAAGLETEAKEDDTGSGDFVIEAQALPTDEPVYRVQLTIENLGADWEGTVRLTIDSGYSYSIVPNIIYDTALSLPQGSTKQFEVRMLCESIERTDGYVTVRLLDAKGNKSAEKNFSKLLQSVADAVPMGILSDSYASLTYLDMGGNQIYFGNQNRPIKLMQLNKDNLLSSLNSLAFLVIDDYDTKTLTNIETEEIEDWIDNGGILIVGTGTNAEKTLGGLDFLDVKYQKSGKANEDAFPEWDYYIDASQLTFAALEDTGNHYYEQDFGLVTSWSGGAVSVLPCALTELGKLGADAYNEDSENLSQENLVGYLYESVSVRSQARYEWGKPTYEPDYEVERILPTLGKGSVRQKFGGLKAIVILYVIFVGPVLYLILRALKKRDFYWIAVPLATLVGIFLIYWAGRGFEIAKTNIYSVTIQELSKNESAQTYLRCYDANHKEWRLRLAEGYTYAGSLLNNYYYYDDIKEDNYYHRIYKEGERLSIGLNPKVSFEDGYFLAGAKKSAVSGAISWNDGIVTNQTQWDFPYIAVIKDDDLMIYKNLAAGQSLNLEEENREFVDHVDTAISYNKYTANDTAGEVYYYGYLRDSLRAEEKEDIDLKAALGMGVASASFQMGSNQILIVGVAENWDKAVDDDCSEMAYGCLYTVLEE